MWKLSKHGPKKTCQSRKAKSTMNREAIMDFLLWFLIGLAIGGTGGGLGGVWIAHNLRQQVIEYNTDVVQHTTQETTQRTDVLQGQITMVITAGQSLTNVNVNIAGLTNISWSTNWTTNATTNWITTNR